MAAADTVKQAFERYYAVWRRTKNGPISPFALGAAVLVVTGLVTTGVAVARTSKPASPIILTIRLHEIATNFTYVPIKSLIGSTKQYHQGDYWAGDDALENASGVTVGRDEYVCVYTNVTTWEELCPDYASIFTGAGGVPAGTLYVGASSFRHPLGQAKPPSFPSWVGRARTPGRRAATRSSSLPPNSCPRPSA